MTQTTIGKIIWNKLTSRDGKIYREVAGDMPDGSRVMLVAELPGGLLNQLPKPLYEMAWLAGQHEERRQSEDVE